MAPNAKMPQVHPIIQLMADEWDNSRKDKRDPHCGEMPGMCRGTVEVVVGGGKELLSI